MKKVFALLLAVLMVCSLAACAAKQDAPAGSAGDWTREGAFEDENGNMLNVMYLEDYDGATGWYVGCILGEAMDMYGGLVPLAGGKLQGEIPDTEKDGSITVSVSEEGEDGLLLEVEGGETYHFIPAVMDENAITLTLNTEGLGQVAYAREGEELQFDDEYPAQSAYWNLLAPETVTIGAKADEGWKFVKWTKDGEDFTTEAQFTVEVAEAVEYVAVFEPAS